MFSFQSQSWRLMLLSIRFRAPVHANKMELQSKNIAVSLKQASHLWPMPPCHHLIGDEAFQTAVFQIKTSCHHLIHIIRTHFKFSLIFSRLHYSKIFWVFMLSLYETLQQTQVAVQVCKMRFYRL